MIRISSRARGAPTARASGAKTPDVPRTESKLPPAGAPSWETEARALLLSAGLVTPAQLAQLEQESAWTGLGLIENAISHDWLTAEQFGAALAQHLDVEWVPSAPAAVDSELLATVSPALAWTHGVVPWKAEASSLVLLARDPHSQLAPTLSLTLGRTVRLALTSASEIERLLALHYGQRPLSTAGQPVLAPRTPSEAEPIVQLRSPATPQSVGDLVNVVLHEAIQAHASDVHLEPFEHEMRIRYRVDGVLHEMSPMAATLARAIASRVKVLAQLDVAEQRVAQDGRIKVRLAERDVDLRVSTLPTQFGESIVLRVLDQSALPLRLEALGLPTEALQGLRQTIARPHGLLIVTGPTGSGKTTTLYSALAALNDVERKILTVEDPVEFEFEGVMQVPVNAAAGLTFGRALRAFLRQDPDVLMVGEIRDSETAQIAVQAALTGHLVLSTMHTNDAAGAVARLVDLGVERFLVASALEGVLAQRLVRRLCRSCDGGVDRGRVDLAAVRCPDCHGTGYRGRTTVAEWLPIDEALRESLHTGATALQLRQEARRRGFGTLRAHGESLVGQGITSEKEIARCCI